jgi:hypothetical protein
VWKLLVRNAESVRKFQPRVALWQPWEHSFILEDATLKELRRPSLTANHRNSFRVAKNLLNPGFQSKPWAGISERFQRYSSHLEFSHNLYRVVVTDLIASQ